MARAGTVPAAPRVDRPALKKFSLENRPRRLTPRSLCDARSRGSHGTSSRWCVPFVRSPRDARVRVADAPARARAPPRSRVRRPNPGISGFWAPGRGAASMACFGRVGGSAGGGSARLGEHRSARSRTVASCTRDRRGRYASDGLSPTRTRGGLPHQDRVFLGSGGALQPQVKKSSLTSPPHRLPINSRPRRPSRLSRSSARSRSRTAPSPSGSACAPATPSGALPSRFHQTPPQAQWGKLLDFFRVPFAVDLSLTIRVPPSRTARYNAKRRHWRRTKLNF